MPDRQPGVPPQHSRTAEPHDGLHGLALIGAIAMDRALGTGRLVGAEGAPGEPLLGIIEETLALRAWTFPAAEGVVTPTEKDDHGGQGAVLALQSAMELFHERKT